MKNPLKTSKEKLKCCPIEETLYANTLEKHATITKPHQHDLYWMLYITEGSGTHEVDGMEYLLKPSSFSMVEPSQVHSLAFSKEVKGYLLFFTKEIYQFYFGGKQITDFQWFSQKRDDMRVLKEAETEFTFVMDLMVKAYQSNDNGRLEKILHLLQYLLLQMPHYLYLEEAKGSLLYQKQWNTFEHILEQSFKMEKSPLFYAQEMGISLKHLNRICVKISGQTLTQVILTRVILQAQRMWMIHPKASLSEIASHLGYLDTAHFSKIFKKYTSMTITAFKKKYRDDKK